jgi:hypothetical protein
MKKTTAGTNNAKASVLQTGNENDDDIPSFLMQTPTAARTEKRVPLQAVSISNDWILPTEKDGIKENDMKPTKWTGMKVFFREE